MIPTRMAEPFQDILEQARSGCREAQDELARLCYPRVERMVHASLSRDVRNGRPWISSRFSTSDVVQEVFRSLLQDLSRFEGETEKAFIGYLAMIARNRIIDAIRFHEATTRDGRRTAARDNDHEPSDEREAPQALAATREEVDLLHDALEQFSEREQLLLRGRLEEDIVFADLAERLGYSSMFAARRAFYTAYAQLLMRMGVHEEPGR